MSAYKKLFSLVVFSLVFFAPSALAAGTVTPLTGKQFDALSPAEKQSFVESIQKDSSLTPRTPSTSSTTQKRLSVETLPAGSVNCSDYYHFGSVQVDVPPVLGSTVPGTPMTFTGHIKNANTYPIVNGQVYAKVFYKNQKSDSLVQKNGYPLVDQFLVLDDVSLKAGEDKPITFTWQVPEFAQGGDYKVAMFFTSAHRYNLLGLTFTDDITGNITNFAVASSGAQVAYLDKNTVTLNTIPFNFAAFIPTFTKDEKVTAHITLVNPGTKATTVALTYSLYTWDAMLPEHLKSQTTELITLKPGEHKTLSHEVAVINSSVSYLVAELKDHDVKSILDIRFGRTGVEESRINFPGVLNYPLKKGQEETLFSCAHSTGESLVKNSSLTLTLKDMQGNSLHSYVWSGDITGAMMGFKDTFTPTQNLSSFILNAKLERGGQVVEDVDMVYDCTKIDPTQCPSLNKYFSIPVSIPSSYLKYLYGALGIIAFGLIGSGFLFWRKRKMASTHV